MKQFFKQKSTIGILLPFLILFLFTCNNLIYSQSPGGVSAGLSLWLKANSGTSTTSDGASLTQWNDFSGNSRNHTQPNGAFYQPKYKSNVFNFNPAVEFDGIDGMQGPAFASGTDAVHVFAMARTKDNGWNTIYGFGRDATHVQWYNGGAVSKPSWWLSGNSYTATALGINYGITSFIMPKDGTTKTIHWNGQSSNVTGINNYSYNSTLMGVGTDISNGGAFSENFNGEIAEVIIYKKAAGATMNLTDIKKIQTYLAVKYGVTISHDYLDAAGNTIYNLTGYDKNIFGIGRDVAQGLDQKQSKSFDKKSFVTIGNSGNISASNAANPTSLPDNSYLIIGDNGGSNSYVMSYSPTTFIPTTPHFRMSRVWKVQETGTVGSVRIRVPAGSERMLVSDTPNFIPGANTQELTLAPDGSGGIYVDIDLNNTSNQYFTFSKNGGAPGNVIPTFADCNPIVNPNFDTGGASGWTAGTGWAQLGSYYGIGTNNLTAGSSLKQSVNNVKNLQTPGFIKIDFKLYPIYGGTALSTAEIYFGGTKYATISQNVSGPATAVTANMATLSVSSFPNVVGTASQLTIPWSSTANVAELEIKYTSQAGASSAFYFDEFSINTKCPGGLAVWYKADDIGSITETGGKVSSWISNVNVPIDAEQPNAAGQPSYVPKAINFNPALEFDGNDILTKYNLGSAAFATPADPSSIFSITTNKSTNADWNAFINFDGLDNFPTPAFHWKNKRLDTWVQGISDVENIHTTTLPVDVPTIAFARIENSPVAGTDGSVKIGYNGLTTEQSFPSTDISSPSGQEEVSVGGEARASYGGAEYLVGTMPEVMVFNKVLSNDEVKRVNTYLGIKYGVTVTDDYVAGNNTTIVWNRATNTGYNNSIFGIGRDDKQELNQKQSQSTNGDTYVTIGNDATIADTNPLNGSVFDADESFLVVGDNDLVKDYATSYAPATFTPVSPFFLMSKIWKVQETGTVGIVRISVPRGPEYLLVSNSSTFTPGSAQELKLTLDGDGNAYADVDLTNGQYFTFGAVLKAPGSVTEGLNLWLKADYGTSSTVNGQDILGWNDASLKGNNHTKLSTSALATSPEFKENSGFNFNPSVNFDGGYNALGAKRFASGSDTLVVFAMTKHNQNNNWGAIYSFARDLTHPQWFATGQPGVYLHGNYDPWNTGSLGLDYGINTFNMKRNPATQQELWWNGVKKVYSGFGGYAFNATNFWLGNDITDNGLASSEMLNGEIMELAVYKNAKMTDLKIKKVESYLAIKYGITLAHEYLAGSGATIWDNVANSAYHNNVFGIARDDRQDLNQKQSKSYNSNGILTIGIDNSIATTNATNFGKFDADESFLMLGDNNTPNGEIVVVTPGGACEPPETVTHYTSRIWKSIETGTVEATKISADLTAYGFDTTQPVFMQIATDAAFTSTDNKLMVKNGANYETSFVPNGTQFIRFAGSMALANNVCTTNKKYAWNTFPTYWNWGQKTRTTTIADQTFEVTISDANNATYLTNWYPVGQYWYNHIFIPRYDANGSNNKIITKIAMKDATNNALAKPASKVSFYIFDLDSYYGKDVVNVYGRLAGQQVNPKFTKPANSPLAISGTKVSATTGIWDISNYGKVFVDFDRPVDEIYIEYTKENGYFFKSYQDVRIGGLSITCTPPVPEQPTPDNVYISKSVLTENPKVDEAFDYKFAVTNLDCENKTIDFTDVLPAGLTWADSSFATSMAYTTLNAYEGGNSLNIDDLVVPPGTTYIYVSAKGSSAGTFENQAEFTVGPNLYLSDDPNEVGPNNPTPVTLQTDLPLANLTITKSVDKATANQNEVLKYTYTITNPNNSIVNTSFEDNLPLSDDGSFTYVGGTLAGTGAAIVNPVMYDGESSLSLRDFAIPANGSLTFTVDVSTGTFTSLLTGKNVATITPDPSSGFKDTPVKSNSASTLIEACVAGGSAPSLTGNSVQNICPTNGINLNSLFTGIAPMGTSLTWHTATPADDLNKVSNPTAAAAGTYYAAFYDGTNGCYSPTSSMVTASLIDCTDTDGDGIIDLNDTDDDSDGIADVEDSKPLDTDNDGTDNSADNDDDGDGIADGSEANGQSLDTDNDNIPNATDTDDDGDGILDTAEIGVLDGNGKYTLPDSDGDGLPDMVDPLDSDGDGTPDKDDLDDDADGIADTQDPHPLDTDNDGTNNATDTDDDGDGILDLAESTPALALDSDNDGIGNEADTDDDNDGVVDTAEIGVLDGNGKYTLPDSDNDGKPDLIDKIDTDGDGIADIDDTDDDGDGISDNQDPKPLDTDNDGVNNDADLDDDGDGIADTAEAMGKILDTDNDGTPNDIDNDDDNDGIDDSAELGTLDGNGKYTLPDSDGDGKPDLIDALDTDGDGVLDSVDLDDDGDGIDDTLDPFPVDTDNDGTPNNTDTDDDGDGIADSSEAMGQILDTDNDNIPNDTDTDDDGDGIPDSIEQGTIGGNGKYSLPDVDGDGLPDLVDQIDTDNDGTPDINDTDDDADGIADAQDKYPLDTDNDNSPNDVDLDDDGDGIADASELPANLLDTDNDNLPNATDTDDDGDGIPDTTEQGVLDGNGKYTLPDSDNNGLPDLADPIDTDGDGTPDINDTDDDNDGIADMQDPMPLDTDNDGTSNATDTDDDGDGIADSSEAPGKVLDTDNDGTPNETDPDDDNDGIADVSEIGPLDGNGKVTLPDSDGDGLPDLADPLDTDGDGTLDALDLDDDNDGIADAQDPKPIDTDNDGIPNATDPDDDGDGILDTAEAPGKKLDTDNDGIPNETDLDDDADGIPDTVEIGVVDGNGKYTLPDSDGDGLPDLVDQSDTDGDGITDAFDLDDDGDGIVDTQDKFPIDTDNDGIPNATDTDDDGDGIADASELPANLLDTDNDGIKNATDTDDDGDGIPDTTEQGVLDGNGKYTLPDSDGDGLPDLADQIDTDGDGTPDVADTDDDGDGITDAQDPKPLDTDNDGTPNSTDTDDDGDGIADASELPANLLDTDNDSIPNATDADDDGDGIPDTTEQGVLDGNGKYTLPDSDGDGLPDLADQIDTDGDGTPDVADTDDDGDGLTDAQDPLPLDTDNDGTPNSTDTDDDGDGIADSSELPANLLDTDNDNIPNATDTDDDGDGIPDTTEQGVLDGNGKYTLPDSDGDGLPDLADQIDTDGDGTPDVADTDDDGDGLSDAQDPQPLDTDNDGTPNETDSDDDGDGIADSSELPANILDTDNDGILNATDTDDDGDGIPDTTEQGVLDGNGKYTLPDSDGDGIPDLADQIDTDGDGTPDVSDTDDDGDGLTDTQDSLPLDTDNDGTPNSTDTDDDGDGIADASELPANLLDTDNDNIPNATDTDDDGDGIPDTTEQGVLDGNGKYTLPDSDGDGIPDLADQIDTDGDGTPDVTDNDDDADGITDAQDSSPLDTDNDGIPNATDPDDDGDGIADTAEPTKALDTDNDGIPNGTDSDDDNDGIADISEIGPLDGNGKVSLPDIDGDGIPDLIDQLDTDGDGTTDALDLDDDADGIVDLQDKFPTDTDNDGTPNATDLDDDGDGIADSSELPANLLDTDNDNIPNATDTDDDNDGIPDITEQGVLDGNGKYTLPDTDGDGIPDLADSSDIDGDGIPDITDTDDDGDGLTDAQDPHPLDTDNDGIPNQTDTDDDGDGIADNSEMPGKVLDTDNDGTPNDVDLDDDNDGIPDTTEQGVLDGNGKYTLPDTDGDGLPDLADQSDTDGDGIPDATDTDDDGDGLADTEDSFPLDTDNDGTPNTADADDDGDGIADTSEAPGQVLDSDNDGLPNATDTDDDGDGIPDTTEQGVLDGNGKYTLPDSDGDGIPDLSDPIDTDGDGTPDISDTDDDGDGLTDAQDPHPLDTDNDGTPNSTDTDDDGDGIADASEAPGQQFDTDNDGTPNATDTDDDGDGIPDTTEQGVLDGNGKYTLPDTDGDGIPDVADPIDTDGDGTPDIADTDDDGDGLTDTQDKFPLDTDNDGTPNSTDPDDDGDGIADISDTNPLDTDNDGMPNATDPDDDNDNIPDTTEQGTLDGNGQYTLPDSDGDGLPDIADVIDTDGDGIPDATDTDDDGDGLTDAQDPLPLDTDNDGTPNATDSDDDGDGIADTTDTHLLDSDNDGIPNATDTDDDGDGIADITEQGVLDGNGKFTLPDSDGDGIPDLSDPLDTDGDGTIDAFDTDDDNDGIADAQDKFPIDTDNDGIPNASDTDDDGDGIADTSDAMPLDTDNDGIPNTTDTDDDNDGIDDLTELGPLDGNGKYTLPDSDGDGIPDLADKADTDGDGIEDALDTDDDNDGIVDTQDKFPIDTDNDGKPNASDADDDGDGITDDVDTNLLDTDNDGTPNTTDTDDDNDNIPDTTEQGTLDGNGKYTLPDSDGDGLPDLADNTNSPIGSVPELTPSLDIASLSFSSNPLGERDFVVDIFELDKGETSAPIVFRVSRISGFDITVPGLTLSATDQEGTSGSSDVGGMRANENGNWLFKQNAANITVTSKPGVKITKASLASIGFHIKRKVGVSSGTTQNINVVIISGTGGGDVDMSNDLSITSVTGN